MEGIVRLGDALTRPSGRSIHFRRTLNLERFVRTLGVELRYEAVELGLLLQDVLVSGAGGILLQSQVHTLMPAVLLWMPRTNGFNGDA